MNKPLPPPEAQAQYQRSRKRDADRVRDAAPELLAALTEAVQEIRKLRHYVTGKLAETAYTVAHRGHVAIAKAEAEPAKRRLVIVCDGKKWYVWSLRLIEHDWDQDEKVYRCDAPISSDHDTFAAAIRALAEKRHDG